MVETYQIANPTDGSLWSQEMPNSAITGHPYLDHIAALVLWNPSGSGRVVSVREIAISPLAERTTTVQTQIALTRITASTGGDTVTPITLDSNNAALPSQVVVSQNVPTITTSGTTLARVAAIPMQNTTRALGFLACSRGAGRFDRGRIYQWQPHSDTQKIVLREGEGLALTTSTTAFYSHELNWQVTFRNASTGATWVATGWVYAGTNNLCTVLNGASSGVVLEVLNVSLWEAGEDIYPIYSLEYVDAAAITAGIGSVLTPVALDSSNTALGTVAVYSNAFVKSEGAKHGAIISAPRKIAIAGVSPGRGPGVSSLDLAGIRPNYLYKERHSDRAMRLREGEGLAVMQRNAGKIGRAEIVMQFGVEESGGGGVVQAVVRAFA